ncbi:MAG: chromate transporter [Propionibacteriaceae bacterium]
MNDARARTDRNPPGTVAEVFWVFLRLGLTSFGGPVAHLGYFRHTFWKSGSG